MNNPTPMPTSDAADPATHLLKDRRVAFLGKLGGVTKREAVQVVKAHGAIPVSGTDGSADLVVIGAEESPLVEFELLSEEMRGAAAKGELEVISETELWRALGLVEAEQSIKSLYTPAMLADLLGISVRVIRKWHRRGLIVPVRTVYRLPYFDFQEIATARRLAELVAAGASSQAIDRRLSELARVLPDAQRPLAQLGVLIEGQQVLLRQGEGLLEAGGQLRIDFDAVDAIQEPVIGSEEASEPPILHLESLRSTAFPLSPQLDAGEDTLLQEAYAAEDADHLETAIDGYHMILARDGARADICFQLGELLYRAGQIEAARERYFMTIELDETFVEARASLGSILVEMGRLELAVAAFKGVLQLHHDYPDVHYNLARTLDDLKRHDEATVHWQSFLRLAPESPWADEAKQRLQDRLDAADPSQNTDP